jgi:putative ABC transport system permease protein
MGKGAAVPLQVAGVVEDLRNTSPAREPYPEVFIDYRHLLTLSQRWGDTVLYQHERALGLLSFAVRTRRDPATAIPAVSQIVRSVDPNAGIDAIVPVEQLVAKSLARPRFYAVLIGVFAAVAGSLAVIGIYGVLAYAVTQRTQEIGIRMALGAQRDHVLALVLRHGVILTSLGVVLGLFGAAAGTRILQGMLFGVTPLDAATFAAVALTFALVAMLASYLPARRATKVDPIVAVRSE